MAEILPIRRKNYESPEGTWVQCVSRERITNPWERITNP